MPIIDPETGAVAFEAQIFVATLGASNYSFAEATASQKLPDWIQRGNELEHEVKELRRQVEAHERT